MRSSRWILCAAATGGGSSTTGKKPEGGSATASPSVVGAPPPPPPPPSPPPSSAAPLSSAEKTAPTTGAATHKSDKQEKAGTAAPPIFRPLRLHAWQALGIPYEAPDPAAASSSAALTSKTAMADRLARLPPSALLYHGQKLGPRPLVILDHSLPPPTASTNTAASPVVLAEARDGDVKATVNKALAALTPSEVAVAGAKKYEPILAHLNWEHGAVYVPLHVAAPADTSEAPAFSPEEESLLELSCRQVAAVLDALDIRWSHFLTYSYGTLVAARMAASRRYPHRIGTFLSLDTPLVTREMVKNAATREELQAAREDVNIPLEELTFAEQMLKDGLEGPLPCPAQSLANASASPSLTSNELASLAKNDEAVYANYLFAEKALFAEEGLVRHETRYTPLRALNEMQHPFQLLVPASGALTDVLTHKEFFGLRRPAVIKSASSHLALLGFTDASQPGTPAGATAGRKTDKKEEASETGKGKKAGKDSGAAADGAAPAATPDAVAKEVADVVGAWLNRFDQDVVLKRRYEQAAKEMTQLMGGGGAAAGGADGAAAASDGKKKGKKEKKEKKKKG